MTQGAGQLLNLSRWRSTALLKVPVGACVYCIGMCVLHWPPRGCRLLPANCHLSIMLAFCCCCRDHSAPHDEHRVPIHTAPV